MAIMPVPTCCELHAHNYTCIPIFLGRRGTPDPTGQLVNFVLGLMFGTLVPLRLYAPMGLYTMCSYCF